MKKILSILLYGILLVFINNGFCIDLAGFGLGSGYVSTKSKIKNYKELSFKTYYTAEIILGQKYKNSILNGNLIINYSDEKPDNIFLNRSAISYMFNSGELAIGRKYLSSKTINLSNDIEGFFYKYNSNIFDVNLYTGRFGQAFTADSFNQYADNSSYISGIEAGIKSEKIDWYFGFNNVNESNDFKDTSVILPAAENNLLSSNLDFKYQWMQLKISGLYSFFDKDKNDAVKEEKKSAIRMKSDFNIFKNVRLKIKYDDIQKDFYNLADYTLNRGRKGAGLNFRIDNPINNTVYEFFTSRYDVKYSDPWYREEKIGFNYYSSNQSFSIYGRSRGKNIFDESVIGFTYSYIYNLEDANIILSTEYNSISKELYTNYDLDFFHIQLNAYSKNQEKLNWTFISYVTNSNYDIKGKDNLEFSLGSEFNYKIMPEKLTIGSKLQFIRSKFKENFITYKDTSINANINAKYKITKYSFMQVLLERVPYSFYTNDFTQYINNVYFKVNFIL